MSLSAAGLLEDLRERFFSPSSPETPLKIGVEVEVIPVHASTRLPALPRGDGSAGISGTARILSELARSEGWVENVLENDPPSWTLSDGSCISFEPGGQIEISSAPHPTASSVILGIRDLLTMIRDAMRIAGIDLVALGVDPCNDVDKVPLQLNRDRYVRMTRYFDSIGPSGIRMMRQTAAVQINVERGPDPVARWALLNALAPYIVALFANSRSYAGKTTGHASYRAHLWRTLDVSRTGLPFDSHDAAQRYLGFALDAGAMRSSDGSSPWLSFRDWMRLGNPTQSDWLFHLSTLFPEVRPKEFFEIRCADAIESDSLAAPIVFVTGIAYDQTSALAARGLLGAASEALLERAGRLGLSDPDIRRVTAKLVALAVDGARRLGPGYISDADVDVARQFFERSLSARSAKSLPR
ncbi:MAG: glutamate-cysteine ligase family protein [Gemmatimonadaceae bacterium]